MSSKANASKRRSQPLKRNSKRKIGEKEAELSEKEVRNTVKKNKSHPKRLSSEVTGQTKHTSLKEVKIASHKRKTWQPLSKNSREHLQTMMESVIIAILSNKTRESEQIQYHLNFLKKSFLFLMQEETEKIVETVESMTGNIHSLKNQVHVLTSEVEEEEKKIKQMLQIDGGVLSLPELPQKSLKAPVLQKEILTSIPNHNTLLKDLEVLHNSSQMKNTLTFIKEVHKRLDAS